jgi:medium-chain acyl-[acyl-carrier-protein] hydrolase
MTEMAEFEKEYLVHVYETSANGKLTLAGLFNYLQDTASDHAERLNFGRDDLLKSNHIWVLSRMYAVIENLPDWNDTITVRTWPSGIDKILALRDFKVLDHNRLPIVSATSSWAIIDRTTKRIQRPDDIITNFHSSFKLERTLQRNASKLDPVSKDGYLSPMFKVKFSDLDINLHVNNVKFLQWVTDSYPLDFIISNSPRSVEINYLAESMCSDEIKIMISQVPESYNIWNHSIIRINDDRELCRIRIEWNSCNEKKVS